MKKSHSNPKAESVTGALDSNDALVEDLLQQDVMPVDDGSITPGSANSLGDTLSQAGRWDDPVGDVGHRAPRQPPEDEVKISEKLVADGINEADEELRELEPEDEEIEE